MRKDLTINRNDKLKKSELTVSILVKFSEKYFFFRFLEIRI
jgi:hypothetical protein